ncbi:hypothetical protein VIGAN_10235000, partial [Vigna angularis var. angularis]
KLQATELWSLLQDLLQRRHIPSFQLQPQCYQPDPCNGKNIGKDQPVKMNIHSLAIFSDIVDIHIGTENHRMLY